MLITRHGRPIARLVGAAMSSSAEVDAAIARLKELRTGSTLGGLDWKALRDADRP